MSPSIPEVDAAVLHLRRRGGFFVCWSGVVYDPTLELVRADKLFLNVVHTSGPRPCFSRLVSMCPRRADGAQYLRYTLAPAVRIQDGPRHNRIVLEEDLREGETGRPAGVRKLLRSGREPSFFSAGRSHDAGMLRLLAELPKAGASTTLAKCVPRLFLTCHPDNSQVYYRNRSEAEGKQVCRPGEDQYFERMADGRLRYDFAETYGKGVVAAGAIGGGTVLGAWRHVKEFSLCLPYLEINAS